MARTANDSHFPVCIVGGGPVGLLLSSLLSQYKVRHCLLERRAEPTSHPQAHFINARSMEILQGHSPTSFRAIVDKMPPSEYWRDFVYCYSVTGRAYSRVDHFASAPRRFWSDTPASVVHLPQNKFEGILRHEASQRARECGAELFFGHAVTGYDWAKEDSREHHVVHLQRPEGGSNSISATANSASLQCTYLVAADGASSLARQSLGISLGGAPALQTLMNIHFTCPGLKARLKPRPAMLYFVFNEATVAVFVAHDPESDEWVCQVPLFPPYRTQQDFDDKSLLRLLRAGLGVEAPPQAALDDIKILSVSTWTMHAEVASQFSNSQDNVFLAGDSAHRFPPAGGFGMNTGLQDAHNLAWRLALVVHGSSSPLLLQGYSRERRAVAQANTDLSMANYKKSITSARLLGVDPVLAKAALASVSLLPVPFAARRTAVNALLDAGLSTLSWLKDGSNVLSELRVRALQAQVDRGSSLPLLFPAEDIGFAYQDCHELPGQAEVKMVDCTSHHLRVGARIPHVWMRLITSSSSSSSSSPGQPAAVISTVNLAAIMARSHEMPVTMILVFVRDGDRARRNLQLEQWCRLFGGATNSGLYKVLAVEAVSNEGGRLTHAHLQALQQCPRHSGVSDGPSGSEPCSTPTAVGDELPAIKEVAAVADLTGCWADSMLSAGWSHTAVAIRPDGHTAAILSSKSATLSREEMQRFVHTVVRHVHSLV